MGSIYHLIKNQADKNPEAIAITSPGRIPLTYRSLLNQIDRIIIQLNAINIGCNDPVAISIPNGAEMAVAFLSIACCATCAPLNPNYRSNEFDFYLEDLNAKALILQSGIAEEARIIAKQRHIPIIELSPLLEAEAGIFTLSNSLITENNPNLNNQFPESNDIALILHTSGTTSRPKMVQLTQKNLCTSAENIRKALDLKPSDRCLNVMPLFHIHGLMGVLLSSISTGASIACTSGFSAPQFFEWLEELKPTWYSAVPTMHQSILARIKENYNTINDNSIRLIRSSSAPLPPQIMAELEKTFNAPVIESYGMTEASHQMASNPLPPLVRKPSSVGIAAGPEIAIMDEEGNLLNSGEVGEVVIRGENVTQGYANNPEANQQAFTNGWFRTGDVGYLDQDNYLFLKGRIKEIINRGGEKISPREVDEILLDHPAIEQVVTFAAPHQLLGEDVAAAVVVKPNASVTEREIQEFAAQKLADFKVPRVVLFLDEIPKGPTGKRQRIGLAEKLGLTASNPTLPRPDYIAPRTPIEEQLVGIWFEVLGIEEIGMDDNFFQLGGDSITATQIINRVRELLKVELSFLIFFQQPTVAKIALIITQIQAEQLESDNMIELLAEIESLSDEDVKNLLNN